MEQTSQYRVQDYQGDPALPSPIPQRKHLSTSSSNNIHVTAVPPVHGQALQDMGVPIESMAIGNIIHQKSIKPPSRQPAPRKIHSTRPVSQMAPDRGKRTIAQTDPGLALLSFVASGGLESNDGWPEAQYTVTTASRHSGLASRNAHVDTPSPNANVITPSASPPKFESNETVEKVLESSSFHQSSTTIPPFRHAEPDIEAIHAVPHSMTCRPMTPRSSQSTPTPVFTSDPMNTSATISSTKPTETTSQGTDQCWTTRSKINIRIRPVSTVRPIASLLPSRSSKKNGPGIQLNGLPNLAWSPVPTADILAAVRRGTTNDPSGQGLGSYQGMPDGLCLYQAFRQQQEHFQSIVRISTSSEPLYKTPLVPKGATSIHVRTSKRKEGTTDPSTTTPDRSLPPPKRLRRIAPSSIHKPERNVIMPCSWLPRQVTFQYYFGNGVIARQGDALMNGETLKSFKMALPLGCYHPYAAHANPLTTPSTGAAGTAPGARTGSAAPSPNLYGQTPPPPPPPSPDRQWQGA